MKAYQKIGAVLALVLGGSATASAAIPLYDNLDGVGTYSDGLPLTYDGYIYNAFSTGTLCPSGCNLDNITLFLTSSRSPAASVYKLEVFLANAAGAPMGSALINFNNPVGGFSPIDANNVFTPIGVNNPLLNDTKYSVVLTGTNVDPFASVSWDYYDSAIQTVPTNPNQNFFQIGSLSGSLSSNLLMQVQATPAPNAIPVPGAIWMMGTALIGLVASGRKRCSEDYETATRTL